MEHLRRRRRNGGPLRLLHRPPNRRRDPDRSSRSGLGRGPVPNRREPCRQGRDRPLEGAAAGRPRRCQTRRGAPHRRRAPLRRHAPRRRGRRSGRHARRLCIGGEPGRRGHGGLPARRSGRPGPLRRVQARRLHGDRQRARPLRPRDGGGAGASRRRGGGAGGSGRCAQRIHVRPVGVGRRGRPRLRRHWNPQRPREHLLVGRDRSREPRADRLAGRGRPHHQRREGVGGRQALRGLPRGRVEPTQRDRDRGLLGPAQCRDRLDLRRRADRRRGTTSLCTKTTCTR